MKIDLLSVFACMAMAIVSALFIISIIHGQQSNDLDKIKRVTPTWGEPK